MFLGVYLMICNFRNRKIFMNLPFEKVRLWQTHFTVLRPMNNLVMPEVVVYEEQTTSAYCCDGRKRFEDGAQLSITLKGRGMIRIKGSEQILTPGRAFLHNHNDPEICYYYPEDASGPWNFLWIAFSGGNSAELIREINDNYGYIFEVALESNLVKTLLEFKNSSGEIQILSPWEGASLISNILKELLHAGSKAVPASGNAALIGAVQSLINSDPGGDWQVEKLAGRFKISREHLSRIFVQETCLPLHDYIIRIRLKMAVDLLLHTRLSGKEIADRCGWKDYSNFYRIFKDRFAHSPQEVRALGIRPQI